MKEGGFSVDSYKQAPQNLFFLFKKRGFRLNIKFAEVYR